MVSPVKFSDWTKMVNNFFNTQLAPIDGKFIDKRDRLNSYLSPVRSYWAAPKARSCSENWLFLVVRDIIFKTFKSGRRNRYFIFISFSWSFKRFCKISFFLLFKNQSCKYDCNTFLVITNNDVEGISIIDVNKLKYL